MDIKITPQGKMIRVSTQLTPDDQPVDFLCHTPQIALQYVSLCAKQAINFITQQSHDDKQTKLL